MKIFFKACPGQVVPLCGLIYFSNDQSDTLAFLGYINEFNSAIVKINSTLNLDGDFMISTFETNIRMLGGLLGGHSVALDLADQGKIKYDNCLLRFAKIIGDKLIPAFNTSTGIPFR